MLLVIAYLTFLVVRPFLAVILGSAVLAYIFNPIYKFLARKTRMKRLSSLMVSILILLLLTLPFVFIVTNLGQEGRTLYKATKTHFIGTDDCTAADDCSLAGFIGTYIQVDEVRDGISEIVSKVSVFVVEEASDFILALPVFFLDIFIAIFTIYYLFIDSKKILRKIRVLMPLKVHHQKKLFTQLDDTLYAVVYGSIIVSIIQGALGGLGFYVVGIPSPLLWGLIMTILAFVPTLGTALVWLPAGLIFIVIGYTSSQPVMIWKRIGLIIYGFAIVSSIDNILKPKIIGNKARVHPVLILLGVFGGLYMFGLVGFIIGPIIVALFVKIIEIYEKERIYSVKR